MRFLTKSFMKLMKSKLYLMILISSTILLVMCKENQMLQHGKKEYSRWVGDIAFNPKLDKNESHLCYKDEDVYQYFNHDGGLQYSGEKSSILEIFKNSYIPFSDSTANGMVRIRFIVNCRGETDRFRILSADNQYQPKIFNNKITDQLLQISKSLTGWRPIEIKGLPRDYYQYLIFKIQNGDIQNILP